MLFIALNLIVLSDAKLSNACPTSVPVLRRELVTYSVSGFVFTFNDSLSDREESIQTNKS